MSVIPFVDKITGELVQKQVPTSPSGDANKFLNEQGNFAVTGSGGGSKVTIDVLDQDGKLAIAGTVPPSMV